MAIVGGFVVLALRGDIGSIAGKFITVLDPFIRAASPLIDSVAEQRISAWGNLYLELGIAILFFLVGLYFVLKNPTNRNIFLLLFAVTALYFASSMIRLLVLFAPAFAIIAGIGIISILKPFFTLLKEAPRTLAKSKRRMPRVSKEYSGVAVFLIFMILVIKLGVFTTNRRSAKSNLSSLRANSNQRFKPSSRRLKSNRTSNCMA